jgi:hypothetical protein
VSTVKLAFESITRAIEANIGISGYIIILHAITSINFMIAESHEFDFGLLKQIVRRIVNEVNGVSRVTYDIMSKPPGIFIQANENRQPFTLNICHRARVIVGIGSMNETNDSNL